MNTQNCINLNGTWALHCSDESTYSAEVPGDILWDLQRAGAIPDPHHRDDALQCRWVGERVWTYRRKFAVSKLRPGVGYTLVFEGIIGVATIFLNGKQLTVHRNLHRSCRIDVAALLREGENDLAVQIEPFDAAAKDIQLIYWHCGQRKFTEPIADQQYCHKCGASRATLPLDSAGGNGFAGFPSCGIWRECYIEINDFAIIRHPFVRPSNDGTVHCSFTLESVLRDVVDGTMTLRVFHNGEQVACDESAQVFAPYCWDYARTLKVPQPKLWYPRGYGDQPLYELEITLAAGARVISQRVRFAFREVMLERRELTADQEVFRFHINGLEIFVRGSNWVPSDLILGHVTAEHRRHLLQLAADCNINYLRIWGGGLNEPQDFYDTCDELGIMIWQEFNFACWEVPDFVPAFREECKREAVELIENLRNHPCIIMWCGSNETDAFYLEIIPPKRPNTYGGYRLYHHDFPQLLRELAPDALYIPSCPCLGLTHGMPNTMGVGTFHGNLPVHQYASDAEYDHVKAYPPFANEIYGIAGDPESSIRRYLDESDLQNWDDPVFVVHNAFFMEACAEKKLFFKYLTYDMPERISDIAPRTLIEYYNEAYCELLKRYTEVFRRKSEICSGAAYWMYNNFSTSMNWAMVDYYGAPKCVWYALKRAYADILPILAVYEDRIDLYLSNLTAKDHRGKLVLSLLSFTGECLFSHECTISVAATKAPLLMQVPSEQLGHFAPQKSFLLAEWQDEDGTVVRNHRYRCSPRERLLPNATIELQRLSDRCFKLHGDILAVNVQLTPWDDKCYPDDNCFDLYPGEDKVITFNVPVNDTPTLHWQNYGAVQLG